MRQSEAPEIEAMIENFELAFRMQKTVPDVMDIGDEGEAEGVSHA